MQHNARCWSCNRRTDHDEFPRNARGIPTELESPLKHRTGDVIGTAVLTVGLPFRSTQRCWRLTAFELPNAVRVDTNSSVIHPVHPQSALRGNLSPVTIESVQYSSATCTLQPFTCHSRQPFGRGLYHSTFNLSPAQDLLQSPSTICGSIASRVFLRHNRRAKR